MWVNKEFIPVIILRVLVMARLITQSRQSNTNEALGGTRLAGYPGGADEYLSPEDAKATLHKWVLVRVAKGQVDCGAEGRLPPCEVLAVCESGCPHTSDNIWPWEGTYHMQWKKPFKGSDLDVTSVVSGSCCQAKSNRCAYCVATNCCSYPLSLFDCEATGTFGRFYPLQRDCCERDIERDCFCRWRPLSSSDQDWDKMCDHEAEQMRTEGSQQAADLVGVLA